MIASMKTILSLFASISLLAACTADRPSAPMDQFYNDDNAAPVAPAIPDPTPVPSTPPSPTTMNGIELLTGTYDVVLHTSEGDISITLDADKAPLAVTNFIVHAQDGYYDDLTFHRVLPDFMIQGGDPSGNGTGGESIYGESFEDEQSGIPMVRGTLAMANAGPRTNGSQFFIIQTDATPWLEGKHTAFGTVSDGMDVVDAIVAVPKNAQGRPNEPVTFTVEVIE